MTTKISDRPWRLGHELNQIADASGQVIGTTRSAADAELVVDAVNVAPSTGRITIDASSSAQIQRAALRFAIECLRTGPLPGQSGPMRSLFPSDTYADAIAALARWSS